jgi:aminoglycoside phosphotransferase
MSAMRWDDARLPGLAIATDDAAMSGTLGTVLGVPAAGDSPAVAHRVLKHTRGKRCVIDYAVGQGSGARRAIGKLYRGDRGDALFRLQSGLLELALREGVRFAMPTPLAYVAPLGMVLQTAVPGVVLSARGADADWSGPLVRTAENLVALHALTPRIGAPRSIAEHLSRQCRPGPEALATEGVAVVERAARLVRRLCALDRPDAARAIAHGDLGLSQVFDDGTRAWFVDLDSLCLSSPALDVANFLVSVHNRLGDAGEAAQRAFLDRYREAAAPDALRDLPLYYALAWYRRAVIACRQLAEPERGVRVDDLLTRAEESLDAA